MQHLQEVNNPDALISSLRAENEWLYHWLARIHAAAHRDTSYESGESLDQVLSTIQNYISLSGHSTEVGDGVSTERDYQHPPFDLIADVAFRDIGAIDTQVPPVTKKELVITGLGLITNAETNTAAQEASDLIAAANDVLGILGKNARLFFNRATHAYYRYCDNISQNNPSIVEPPTK